VLATNLLARPFICTDSSDSSSGPSQARQSQTPLPTQSHVLMPHEPPHNDDTLPTLAPAETTESNNANPVELTPSADYLGISLTPSRHLPISDRPSCRKLLILDLNGTLLFRSPTRHKRRKTAHLQHGSTMNPPGIGDGFVPRLRTVHPRPYIGAFRSYLFAPSTRAWLDTMVWSSAQPNSVEDMVDKCFGPLKSMLVAIWSRDTLGLTEADYCMSLVFFSPTSFPVYVIVPLFLPFVYSLYFRS
jgi:hypothetical protein